MIYLYCYLFLLLSFALGRLLNYRGAAFLVLGALPSIFVVTFRGAVGFDTAVYFANYQKVIEGVGSLDFEPGFVVLIRLLAWLVDSPQFIQAVMSLLIAMLLLVASYKVDEKGFFFVGALYPVFFFELTMNAIRFGFAFALFMLGIIYLKRPLLQGWLFLSSAIMFHVSSFLLILLALLRSASKSLLLLGGALTLVAALAFYERLLAKAMAYQMMESLSLFSGIVPLILTLSFIAVAVYSIKMNNENRQGCGFMSFMALLAVLAFIVAKFTYAGLRLQWLLLAFCMFHYFWNYRAQLGARSYFWFSMVGFLGFAANYRYYADGYMKGASPFLPYLFYWESG